MVFRIGNRVLIALLAALVLSPRASAWVWPVDGPVLRPFVLEGDPYTGGQHRGIDVGAPSGSDVRSPADGIVSFAGRLPRQGLCLTVRTADGWSVTLVHLGSIGVAVGTQIGEGDVVGTVGPSGEPEGTEPYLHLGVRHTADENGYVDPLTVLPPRQWPEQPPPVQPPPPVQLAAPPVAAGHAAPTRSVAPPRHAAAERERPAARSPRTLHAAVHAPARTVTKPQPTEARVRHARRPRAGGRVEHRPAARPLPSVHAPRVSRSEQPLRLASIPSGGVTTTFAHPVVRTERARSRRFLLIPLGALGLALVALGLTGGRRRRSAVPRRFAPPPLRKMSKTEPAPEEPLPEPSTTAHSRRRRVALREWPAASGACRRLRRSVRHRGPVSPVAGRRRPDGQRHRRARNARHDRGGSRGSVAA
jgi:hypothetical protein